jgi:hypothetical protein
MDLSAISPSTRTVALGRATVEVAGLSLRSLTQLIAAYPALVGLAIGGKVDLTSLVLKGPEMGLAIFSLGVVGPAQPNFLARFWRRRQSIADDNLIETFDNAATGQQLDALADIVELTFRGERGVPFLKGLLAALSPSEPDAAMTPSAPGAESPTETRESPSPTSSTT